MRRGEKPAPPPPRISRLQARLDAGGRPDLPWIDRRLEYLVGILMEAGPTSLAGVGESAISWADLRAWQDAIGYTLQPWEARAVRQLSYAYLSERHRATAHDAPPPWVRKPRDKAQLAKHIRNVLRG